MKTLRKNEERLDERLRHARMEPPDYLPDPDALFALVELAGSYSSEIARGPFQPRGAGGSHFLALWSQGWHPSSLLDDDDELQRGPGSDAFPDSRGGPLSQVVNWRCVKWFKDKHQAALVKKSNQALDSNSAFIELQKVPAFRAALKAFEDAKAKFIGSVSSSRLHDCGAREALISILANALVIYRVRARRPKMRTSPTKNVRDSAVGHLKRLRPLFKEGGLISVKGGREAERALNELLEELASLEILEKQQASGRRKKRAEKADKDAPKREALANVTQRIESHFGTPIPQLAIAFADLIGYKNPSDAGSR